MKIIQQSDSLQIKNSNEIQNQLDMKNDINRSGNVDLPSSPSSNKINTK